MADLPSLLRDASLAVSRSRAWRHVLHYRDLYQQKLSYVREFLSSVDRLEHWTSQVTKADR